MSKYDDCHRVDNRYTTAIGMSVWRFFNVGKYKNQKVKDVCYFNPFYVAWCLCVVRTNKRLWNKYISSKENIRVNITSAIIFK